MKRLTIGFLIAILILGLCPAVASAKDELKNTDPDRFFLVLDLNNQVVTVYQRDENGEYTDIVRRFVCSSGKPTAPDAPADAKTYDTPTGIWKLGGRRRMGTFAAFGDWARYWVQIVGDNIFHSVLFRDEKVTSIKSYNELGARPASHGCVRLAVEDAKWLYYYACPGTTIEVTNRIKKNAKYTESIRAATVGRVKFAEYKVLQANFYDTEELPNDKCWVSVEGARIFKSNDKVGTLVGRPAVGTELEVLMESPAFYMVRFEKKIGYILRGYITLTEGVVDTVENATLMGNTTMWMYTEPDDKSERICKVPKFSGVKLIEKGEKFSLIQYYDEIGYVTNKSLITDWGLAFDTATE
ncbi:MAG: L,D-transpeptidase [Clostridiales bacterium]|nr:L,D-transpeptidase [Clostridiales bacterium]